MSKLPTYATSMIDCMKELAKSADRFAMLGTNVDLRLRSPGIEIVVSHIANGDMRRAYKLMTWGQLSEAGYNPRALGQVISLFVDETKSARRASALHP